MIRDSLDLKSILQGFETTLKIEYNSKDIDTIVKLSKSKLENYYRVKLQGDIYDMQARDRLIGDSLSGLLEEIIQNMKSLSLLLSISLYDHVYGQVLKDVSYLGFDKDKLLTALKYLQDIHLYGARKSFFSDLIARADKLDNCTIKRLLVIMAILESLGIQEGVSVIAQYLYLGGI